MTTATIERPRLRYLTGRVVPPKYWEPNKGEQDVLDFVQAFYETEGRWPKPRDVVRGMSYTQRRIYQYLSGLRYKGHLPEGMK